MPVFKFHIVREMLPGQRHATDCMRAAVEAPDKDQALDEFIRRLPDMRWPREAKPGEHPMPEQIELPIVE